MLKQLIKDSRKGRAADSKERSKKTRKQAKDSQQYGTNSPILLKQA
jgi:hypothetical protein